jgi:hypothetical protein
LESAVRPENPGRVEESVFEDGPLMPGYWERLKARRARGEE